MNMISNEPRRVARRKKRRQRKILFIVVSIVVALALIAGVLLLTVFKPSEVGGQRMFGKVTATPTELTPGGIYVLPGTVIYPNVDITYTDIFKNTVTLNASLSDTAAVSINTSAPATLNGKTVVVNQDATAGRTITVSTTYEGTTYTANYITTYLLSETVNEKGIILDPYRFDTLINKTRSVTESFRPKDLVTFSGPFVGASTVNEMNKTANDALILLFNDAKKKGFEFKGLSGKRTWATQAGIYSREPADSAKPGQSEHQIALAMDVVSSNMGYLSQAFGNTEEGKWLAQNCHLYGFIIRYPKGKEAITGYPYEPWHVRYVGVEFATYLYNNNLTMEEFFANSNAALYTPPASIAATPSAGE